MDWLRCQNLLLYSLNFDFRIWLLARSPLSPKKKTTLFQWYAAAKLFFPPKNYALHKTFVTFLFIYFIFFFENACLGTDLWTSHYLTPEGMGEGMDDFFLGGGSYGFQGEQRGCWPPIICKWGGGGIIRIFQRLEGGQVDLIVTQSKSSDTQAINYSDRSHC